MKNSWIIPVATLVVGAAGGYISGKGSGEGGDHSALEESAIRTRASARTEGVAGGEASRKSRGANTAEITRMPGNTTRIQALMDFYAGLTADQLAEEATKLEALPMNERIMASFLLFGRWAEVDPTAAMTFSSTMGFAGNFVRPTILQSWASTDPANAAKYYAENPRDFAMMGMMGRGPGGGQTGSSIIASEWARQDPAAAMAWASSLTTEKSEAMRSVIGEMAKTDPASAISMLSQMDEGDRSGAYRSIASEYGAKDFDAAQAWISTLPADEQARTLASAIDGLSNTNPQLAALELSQMEEGDAKDRLLPDVVSDLARSDVQAAAKLVKEQGSEEAQRDSMRELMPVWASQNPSAALAYAQSFEPGRVQDSALRSYVWGNSKGEPAELVKVAEGISDKEEQSRTVAMTAARWMREDESAAKEYVASSTVLSDDAKKRLNDGDNMWDGGRRGGGGNRGR